MADDCIFCSRAAGNPQYEVTEVVFEDANVKAFRDLNPKAPVHIICIPKTHIVSIRELEEVQAGILVDLVFTARRLAATYGLKGYKLVFNVGREGGQVIDHLHLHLLGGWKGDGDKVVSHPNA